MVSLDTSEAEAWLAFLMERQPHKRMELLHRKQQLRAGWAGRRVATSRLEELAWQYPTDFLVFKTKQRLLGK